MKSVGLSVLEMPYTLKVSIHDDETYGNAVIKWLTDNGFKWQRDYEFDMNAGLLGYCSFNFKSRKLAIWTALVWIS